MTPIRLFCIICAFLLASVPWFYGLGSSSSRGDEGLPDWALHSFEVMLLFAAFIVYALWKYWSAMAGEDENPLNQMPEEGGSDQNDR